MNECDLLIRADNINAFYSTKQTALVISADVTIDSYSSHAQICRNPLEGLLPASTVHEFMVLGMVQTGTHPDRAAKRTICASFPMDLVPAKIAVYSMGTDNPVRIELDVGTQPLQSSATGTAVEQCTKGGSEMSNGSDSLGWDQSAWKDINDAIQQVVGEIRVTTQVWVPQLLPGAQNILDQRINTGPPLSMDEGSTKPFVKIRAELLVTQNQVDANSDSHAARTLAKLHAATHAQTMDGIVFQGQDFKTPPGFTVERPPTDHGLFGIAGGPGGSTINVDLSTGSGEVIYEAVVKGIAALNAKGMSTQQKQCALFLESGIFAKAQAALPNTMVTPASSIAPLVGGGFFATSGLPLNTGLLVSLGGDPTDLAIRDEATVTWLHQDGDGHHFEVYGSFQYIAKDPRALVQLNFNPGEAPGGRAKGGTAKSPTVS
jgi:hypothetical protein